MTTTLNPTTGRPRARWSARSRGRWPLDTTTTIIYAAWVAVFVIGVVLVELRSDNSLLADENLRKILEGMSLLGFVAIGQTMAILCRSLDLSVAYVAAWSTLLAATTMDGDPARIVLGVAVALGVAAAVGLVNGLVITKLQVNSFIATLGTGLIIKGYLDTTYKRPAGDVPPQFRDFGFANIGVVPISTIVMIALAVVATLVLRRTVVGYQIFAVGGNDEVARYSGIRTHRTIIAAHIMCSVAAGIAGLLLAARYGTGDPRVYDNGYDLDSIAAVVLGGTLLMGGRGSVAGTVAGVGILAVLDTVFDALEIDAFFKLVLRGSVIVVAVALYARSQIDRQSTRQRFTRLGVER